MLSSGCMLYFLEVHVSSFIPPKHILSCSQQHGIETEETKFYFAKRTVQHFIIYSIKHNMVSGGCSVPLYKMCILFILHFYQEMHPFLCLCVPGYIPVAD